MMPPADIPDLNVIQRWMLSVITHPEGVKAGIDSDAARGQVSVTSDQIESMVCRSQLQSSLERLAVYSNAYKARLLEVLIGEYPALVRAVGEEIFIGLAAGYLEHHPPHSYTLALLGNRFPEHLAKTRPPNENPDGSPDWADFLIDLARLERAYSEVFDGPGIEHQQTLHPDELQQLSPEQWLSARLVPAPCLRLMTFHFPVHEYASSVRRDEVPDPPESAITHLAITRREFVVRRIGLSGQEFAVLSDLVEGRAVHEALNRAVRFHSGPIDELASQLRGWFRKWSAAGYFIGLS